MNAQPPVKKGRKYDQVIAGAREVFLREGYEGASVDVIARDAGVSKATLYSYFPDKQALFLAVLSGECDIQKRASTELEFRERDVPQALHGIAESMIGFLLSETGLAIFRVCVGEAQRFPEIGRAFYETGPRMGMAMLSGFLASPKAQAVLDIDDPDQAADTFISLCRSDLMLRRIMGVDGAPDPAVISAAADEAVRTFLARYARR
ncbi:TetR family transcriptional regulator [Rhodobacterales bacterium HKCCE3408]|nr:TetR family transcriptional regulator [Rhodobacterales bacterium HKCCE3408]